MKKHIASVSFGKDSLAMLLLIINYSLPLDEVVFYDTGMEFQAIYDTRDAILPLLEYYGIKYTELFPKKSFNYLMFDKPVKKKGTQIVHKHGYSWCGGPCRWGTTKKVQALDKYCRNAIQYVGLACDEQERIRKTKNKNKIFILDDFQITESDALHICLEDGFNWKECGVPLYDMLDRVSCWCCRNKNLKELQNIYKNLPTYWKRLVDLESKLGVQMKPSGTLGELEQRYLKTGSMKKKRSKI